MKRRISLLLVACIILTSLMSLTSCFHFCKFSEEWTYDEEYHWHACTNPKCTEVEGLQKHSLDAGEITTKATQEADGVLTRTCSVCNAKTESPIIFHGLDYTGWSTAFAEENFINFTYKERAYVDAQNVSASAISLLIYKFTEDEVHVSITSGGVTKTDSATGPVAETTRASLVKSIQDMLQFGIFTYDKETKTYNLTGTMKIASLGVNAKTATLTFKDGKPEKLVYTCVITRNGISMDCESTITFADYGTTVID